MRGKHVVFFLMVGLVVAIVGFFSWPHPAAAQCGSSASSCKNCHEVQKQDPVNAKGEWHTAHAFGDFCEFCHAGNVKAKDKAGAHTGLINPLSDVKGSCQSCHPNDYMARAQKFADALGQPIGSGGGPAATTGSSKVAPTTNASSTSCGPAAPTDGQVIDLNKVYAEGTSNNPPTNFGNIVLLGLIGATVVTFGGLANHYEHPLERGIQAWRHLLATPVLATAPAKEAARPELAVLMPLLSTSDTETVRAITHLLSDRENGPKILQAMSHMDLQTLAMMGESDQKALATLLALAKELKS